jgi:hypothetical protein
MTTTVHDQLRIDTCRMLKYDVNALSPAQEVRLARAVVLRLELDDVESRKLQGAPFDAGKYITISEALERLVGGNPEAPAAGHDFSGAREELSHFFAGRADALERRDRRIELEMAVDPDKFRRELEDKIQAAISKYQAVPKTGDSYTDPASGFARYGSVSPAEPVEQPPQAAGGCESPEVCRTAPPHTPRAKSEAELIAQMERTNNTPPPDRYLKGPSEEWQKHIDGDGNIISPWFRPHG